MRDLDRQRRESQNLAKGTGREILKLLEKNLGSVPGRRKARDFLLRLQEETGKPRDVIVCKLSQIPGLSGLQFLRD